MVRLTISYNGEHLKTYELEIASVTVGRLPENTISIANMGISRRHFRVEADASHNYILTDLSSLNGTYVNGTKVKTGELSSGDVITVGKYSMLFETVRQDQPAAPAAPATYEAARAPLPPATVEREEPEHREEMAVEVVDDSGEPGTVTARRSALAEPAASGAVLIETDKHVVYKIEKTMMTLGSSQSDDVFVTGFLIGDGHLVLEKREDGIWVKATKLIGKFRVNGQKVKEHRLEHKDRIELGNSTFRFMENE